MKDLRQVKCIKDEDQKVLVNEQTIKEKWKQYFSKIPNECGETNIMLRHLTFSEKDRNFIFYSIFFLNEMK